MKIKLNNDVQYRDFLAKRLKNLSESIENTHKIMRNIKSYEGVSFEDPSNFGVLVEYFDNIALNKFKNLQNDSYYFIDNLTILSSFFNILKKRHGFHPFGIKFKTFFKPERTGKYNFQAIFSDGGYIFY